MTDPISLINTYQPSSETLEVIKKVRLIAVVGPSGVGKTTLMKQAIKDDRLLHFVLTDVSRPQRPGEQPDVDYHFSAKADMLKLIETGAYVQVALHPSGDIYTTRPESYDTDSVNMMAVLAGEIPHFRHLPFRDVRTIFIVPPDFKTWQARMSLRNFTPQQHVARLAEAQESFSFALDDQHIEFVINDNLDQAETSFQELVGNRKLLVDRATEQNKAREIIKTVLNRLP